MRAALRRRGLLVEAAGSVEARLKLAPRYRDDWYSLLLKYSFRLFLRDLIKNRERARLVDLTRYCNDKTARRYLAFLEKAGIVTRARPGWKLSDLRINSFGPTLEWLVAEILRREFGAVALASVRLCRPSVGGDYDAIAFADGRCLYVEAKSAPPRQLDSIQIKAFVKRVQELAPDMAILLNDTHLRMADKVVPLLERELLNAGVKKRGGRPLRLTRLEGETFHLEAHIFITNSHPDIRANLMSCLSAHWRRGFMSAGGFSL